MMCSLGVLRATWLVILTSVSSTCSGVAPSRRANCVSVLILLGIRLSRPMRTGRMSWRTASVSRMTMTPSASSVERAGRSSGILIGIASGTTSWAGRRGTRGQTALGAAARHLAFGRCLPVRQERSGVLGDSVAERPILLQDLDDVDEQVLAPQLGRFRQDVRHPGIERLLLLEPAGVVAEDLHEHLVVAALDLRVVAVVDHC